MQHSQKMEYLQIQSNGELPDLSKYKPFKCIVIIEQQGDSDWQAKVSDWLCSSGCLYMMAFGKNCSSWDDSVDFANIKQFGDKGIPEESNIVTTWHENEPLSEVFWFAKHSAFHDSYDLKNTIILHISDVNKCHQFKNEYADAIATKE